MNSIKKCKACDYTKESEKPGEFWFLKDYYGFTGCFCSTCYDMISHDSYGNPTDPAGYTFLRLKLSNNCT